MQSLEWVDKTYVAKHESEDQSKLRALYYPNLMLYNSRSAKTKSGKQKALDGIWHFSRRYGTRAALSLAVYFLSYVPIVGKLVLPAVSFYTFNKAVGVAPALAIFATGIVLPRRYLVVFLQTYFSSRSMMRELVRTELNSIVITLTC